MFDSIQELQDKLPFSHLTKPVLIGLVALLLVAVLAGQLFLGTATANDETFNVDTTENSLSEEEEPTRIFVHISGAVNTPGLIELDEGQRIGDAITAAGGFKEDAQTDSVNLARVLSDGEQIHVSSKSNAEVSDLGMIANTEQGTSIAASPVTGLININTATSSELQNLPGIGSSTAEKIISDRNANGSFKTIEDLKRVNGIGDKKFEKIAPLICV